MGLGAMNGRGDMSRQEQRAYAEEGDFPPWIENLGTLIAPVAPTVALDVQPYMPLEPGAEIEVPIAPGSDPFRVVTFELTRGTLDITYRDSTEQAQSLDLDEQNLTLPKASGKPEQRRSGSVLAFKRGGRLTLRCVASDSTPCWVTTTRHPED